MYNINILPPKMRKKQKKKVKIKIGNPTYAPFLLLGVIVTCGVLSFQLDKKIENIEESNISMKSALNTYTTQSSEINRLVQDIQGLKSQINEIKNPSSPNYAPTTNPDGFKWDLFLDEVAATTPAETAITAMNQPDPRQASVIINFETYTLSNMARTKEAFEKSPYFENVQISNVKQSHTNLIARPLEVTFSLTVTFVDEPKTPSENSSGQGMEGIPGMPNIPNMPNMPGVEGREAGTTQSAETDFNNGSNNGNE